MPLKVTLNHGERMTVGEVEIKNAGPKAKLTVNAPQDMDIKRWRDDSPQTRNADKGQTMTPEQQRERALSQLRRKK